MGDGSPYYAVAMKPSGLTPTLHTLEIFGCTKPRMVVLVGIEFIQQKAHLTFGAKLSNMWKHLKLHLGMKMLFAGYYYHSTDEGGVFGRVMPLTWSQILLHTTSIGHDVDVFDIAFNIEGSDTVAYVGVEYDLSSPAGRSVYGLLLNQVQHGLLRRI